MRATASASASAASDVKATSLRPTRNTNLEASGNSAPWIAARRSASSFSSATCSSKLTVIPPSYRPAGCKGYSGTDALRGPDSFRFISRETVHRGVMTIKYLTIEELASALGLPDDLVDAA